MTQRRSCRYSRRTTKKSLTKFWKHWTKSTRNDRFCAKRSSRTLCKSWSLTILSKTASSQCTTSRGISAFWALPRRNLPKFLTVPLCFLRLRKTGFWRAAQEAFQRLIFSIVCPVWRTTLSVSAVIRQRLASRWRKTALTFLRQKLTNTSKKLMIFRVFCPKFCMTLNMTKALISLLSPTSEGWSRSALWTPSHCSLRETKNTTFRKSGTPNIWKQTRKKTLKSWRFLRWKTSKNTKTDWTIFYRLKTKLSAQKFTRRRLWKVTASKALKRKTRKYPQSNICTLKVFLRKKHKNPHIIRRAATKFSERYILHLLMIRIIILLIRRKGFTLRLRAGRFRWTRITPSFCRPTRSSIFLITTKSCFWINPRTSICRT